MRGHGKTHRVGIVFSFATVAVLAIGIAPAANTAPIRDKQASVLEAGLPQRELSNRVCKLTVLLPDAEKGYYRGTRFDWSGLIYQATYQGHTFFGPWKTSHDPLNHDDTAGPVEEFGMQVPLGYVEARTGQPFGKIGVGLLEKIEEPEYRFWYSYKLTKPGAWQITAGEDWIEFRQDLTSPAGWGYEYAKRIQLEPARPVFVIDHRLRNTGSRTFTTNHYCHNFTRIDADPVGPAYEMTLPFEPQVKDARGLDRVASFRKNKLVFRQEIKEGQDLFAQLLGSGPVADNRFSIANVRSGAGIRMEGDRALAKYNLYAARLALCPEPFIEFKLPPREEFRWTTRYTLFLDR
jgi:hypothetical protein